MKRLVLALLLATPLLAAPRTYVVAEDGKNTAVFESQATLETIHGVTAKVSGTISADPANVAASSANIVIGLDGLATGISMRDEHMKSDRFLDVEKFPNATFKTVSVSGPKQVAPNQPVDITVTGDFTLHGVTKRITAPVRVVLIPESELTKSSRGPGDWVHATTSFTIKLTDFGMAVPEKLMMKLSNEVKVRLDLFAGTK
jgi:polyisoprenoid-binding protein YceI